MRILITGATAGIGAACAQAIAAAGHAVIVHGRSAARCAPIVDGIKAAGGQARAEVADLGSLAQVRALAGRLAGAGLDGILNNAGVWVNARRETEDGFELTWQVNHLAPFLLVHHLLPGLLERPDARVINVSSSGHRSGRLHLDDVGLRRGFTGLQAYCQSKLANVLFTQELARRTAGSSLVTHAVDPGAVTTKLLAETGFSPRSRTPEDAVKGWVPLVYGELGRSSSGGYFGPDGQPSRPATRDPESAAQLWALSEKQLAPFLA